MRIPPQQPPEDAGHGFKRQIPPQSMDPFRLDTVKHAVSGNPLAALQALHQWRDMQDSPESQPCKWALDQMPLRVWIQPDSSKEAVSHRLLFESLRQWEAASEGLIRFRLMDASITHQKDSDIAIIWSDETVLGRDYEVGHAHRDVQGSLIRHVDITLIRNPEIDKHLGSERQRQRLIATVLHEVGHALGLEHSENSQDVMYFRGWQRSTLSNLDIRRLRDLYRRNSRSI